MARMVPTTCGALEISIPARSSIPPLLANAFCMSTITMADRLISTSKGSGLAFSFTMVRKRCRSTFVALRHQLPFHLILGQCPRGNQFHRRRNAQHGFDLLFYLFLQLGAIQ